MEIRLEGREKQFPELLPTPDTLKKDVHCSRHLYFICLCYWRLLPDAGKNLEKGHSPHFIRATEQPQTVAEHPVLSRPYFSLVTWILGIAH